MTCMLQPHCFFFSPICHHLSMKVLNILSILLFVFLIAEAAYHPSKVDVAINANMTPNKDISWMQGHHVISIPVIHRRSLVGFNAKNLSSELLLKDLLDRDESRIQSMWSQIKSVTRVGERNRRLIDAPVSSGLSMGTGEYFVRLGVGTPTKMYYLEIDTGSDVSWIQCSPCRNCYRQVDPIFDPQSSSSYMPVYCGSTLCNSLENGGCQGSYCAYQLAYSDQSSSSGDFATETFSLNGVALRNVAFGCGHSNSGLFLGQAGLLGLGGGRLSFSTQMGAYFGSVFSYCLVNRDNSIQSSSPLVFGPNAIPSRSGYTILQRHPSIDTFYYGILVGISVGGSMIPVPSYVYQMQPNGTGGLVIDSGTSVSRLVSSAYFAFRDAFRAQARNLPSAPAAYLLDTCYSFAGMQSVQVPSVVLHFQNGVDMALPGNNIVIPVDNSARFCLAFASSNLPLSILANIQQQTFRIGFDTQRALISIAPQHC